MTILSRLFLLLAFLSSAVSAQSEFTSKEWTAVMEPGSDFYFAATQNDSGHMLGQYCYFEDGSCVYLMAMNTRCESGSQYPALINSDSGSAQATVLCSHSYEQQHIVFIYPFDDVDRIVRQATNIGVAIPMAEGQFRVSRFGLAGSNYALDRMRAAAESRMQRQPSKRKMPSQEDL